MSSAVTFPQPVSLSEQEVLNFRVAGNLSMLCALGSADRIAAYLSRKGVNAKRRMMTGCAIAVYLFDKSEIYVQVSKDAVTFDGPLGEVAVQNPEHLREFIRRFDSGMYPELDMERNGESPRPSAYDPDSAA